MGGSARQKEKGKRDVVSVSDYSEKGRRRDDGGDHEMFHSMMK